MRKIIFVHLAPHKGPVRVILRASGAWHTRKGGCKQNGELDGHNIPPNFFTDFLFAEEGRGSFMGQWGGERF